MTTTARPPRVDIRLVPYMRVGMDPGDAYRNGYRHGYEGVVTSHVCTLVVGSVERREWMRGYLDGSSDRGE